MRAVTRQHLGRSLDELMAGLDANNSGDFDDEDLAGLLFLPLPADAKAPADKRDGAAAGGGQREVGRDRTDVQRARGRGAGQNRERGGGARQRVAAGHARFASGGAHGGDRARAAGRGDARAEGRDGRGLRDGVHGVVKATESVGTRGAERGSAVLSPCTSTRDFLARPRVFDRWAPRGIRPRDASQSRARARWGAASGGRRRSGVRSP